MLLQRMHQRPPQFSPDTRFRNNGEVTTKNIMACKDEAMKISVMDYLEEMFEGSFVAVNNSSGVAE